MCVHRSVSAHVKDAPPQSESTCQIWDVWDICESWLSGLSCFFSLSHSFGRPVSSGAGCALEMALMVGGKEKEGAILFQDAHTWIMKGISLVCLFVCFWGGGEGNVCSTETEIVGGWEWQTQELRGWDRQVSQGHRITVALTHYHMMSHVSLCGSDKAKHIYYVISFCSNFRTKWPSLILQHMPPPFPPQWRIYG